jgi:hypothetical protein
MTILPLTYLGSTDYFAHILSDDCVVDVGENWVKQTVRNRCEILTANGVAALTVPVHGSMGNGKVKTKDIKIDNSKNWRHRHWLSIVSAYRNSPFFDHYEERFAPVFEKKFNFLIELNFEMLNILTEMLGVETKYQISESYVTASPDDIDLRGKKALRMFNNCTKSENYTQVFSDRMDFVPGLSVIDLLFCESARVARQMLQRRSYRH